MAQLKLSEMYSLSMLANFSLPVTVIRVCVPDLSLVTHSFNSKYLPTYLAKGTNNLSWKVDT